MLDLGPIKKRCEAACSGAWRKEEIGICGQAGPVFVVKPLSFTTGGGMCVEDAEFIVHAQADILALVAEVVDLRQKIVAIVNGEEVTLDAFFSLKDWKGVYGSAKEE